MKKKNSWLTTIGAVFAAGGSVMQQMDHPTIKTIGGVLLPTGILILGGSAKDFNVTGTK